MGEAFALASAKTVGDGPAPFEEYRRHQGRYFPDIVRTMDLPLAREEALRPRELPARAPGEAVATGGSGERARSPLTVLGLLPSFAM